MSTIYVWSGATGAADGTSWTDAYTTLQAALTAWTTSDVIYVHTGVSNTHSESAAADYAFTAANDSLLNPVPVYGVDKNNSDAYTPSASFNINNSSGAYDVKFQLSAHFYGLRFGAGRMLYLNQGNYSLWFTDAHLETNTNTGGVSNAAMFLGIGEQYTRLYNTDIVLDSDGSSTLAGVDVAHIEYDSGRLEIIGGSITQGRNTTELFKYTGTGGSYADLSMTGTDLTGIDASTNYLLNLGSNNPGLFTFNNCKIPSGTTLVTVLSQDGQVVSFNNCDSGSSIYRTELHTYRGSTVTDTGVYSSWGDETDGGGGTSLSYAMTPNSGKPLPHAPVAGIPMVSFLDSTGSKTFTLEVLVGDASGGLSKKLTKTVTVNQKGYYEVIPYLGTDALSSSPNDSNAWIEVRYLGTASSPLVATNDSQPVPPAAASTLAAGGGGWTGTTVDSVMYVNPGVSVA